MLVTTTLFGQEYERYKHLLDTSIASNYLGFEKEITVTVPFEWQEDLDRTFPLIIVFDRQNERSHGYILHTIDYLTSNEQMPSAVVISVASEQQYRSLETTHKASNEKGLAKENELFIFNELIPLAEQSLHASSFRLLIGHSRYGYFTTALFTSRQEDLNGVIALSPFFRQSNVDLTDSLRAMNKLELNAHKYYRFGIGNDYPTDFYHMDSAIQELEHPAIDAKGELFEAADHNVTPGLTIGVALYEVFERWSDIQAQYFSNAQKDLGIIAGLREEIEAHYGHPLAFALGILNGKGWYFYNEEAFEKAIEAWQTMMETYPNFSEGFLYIMDAQTQLGKEITKTIDLFHASLARSSIYSPEERDELLSELESLKDR
jgi:tetratricopeptide (TPR) repeat protein